MIAPTALTSRPRASSATVTVAPSPSSGHIEVTFEAPAVPGQLARFSGVLTLCDLDIVWATIRVQADTVRDTFECVPLGDVREPDHIREQVARVLDDVVTGRASLTSALAARQHAAGPRLDVAPAVEIDTDSELTTGVRVRTADRPGLLHDLAAVLTSRGLRTRSITVLTVAGIARDTFRVVGRDGEAPREPHALEDLRMALLGACR